MITEVPGGGTVRIWRPPVTTRIAMALGVTLLAAGPGGLLALVLVTSQVQAGGWIALALAVAVGGPLAWRAVTVSAALTPDMLVIRNILETESASLAHVTAVRFRRGQLRVTVAPKAQQYAVAAASLGPSRWSGRRTDADALAEAIAAGAGLPALRPRKVIISRGRAWIILLAAALCFGFGIYWGPLDGGRTHLPFAVREAGSLLYIAGTGGLAVAGSIIRDYRRNRIPRAAADGQN